MEQIIRLPKQKIANILLFLFFLIFPFGQIVRLGRLQPIDAVITLCFVFTLLVKQKEPGIFAYSKDFLIVAGFSYLFSIFVFGFSGITLGGLYLIRLVVYAYFFLFALRFSKKTLLGGLLAVSVFSAIFGWFQYFVYPDLTALKYLGWDDHLFRMVGTFLDPAFLALILVLGATIALFGYLRYKKILYLISFTLLSVSLAFTYSRAGYLAFFVLPIYWIIRSKRKLLFYLISLLFISLVLILPRPAGEGVRLERVAGIAGRVGNYSESFKLFEKSPVFGIGYNNLCLAKQRYFNFRQTGSHSCSGLDSSLTVILATTGVVGLLVFIYAAVNVFKSLPRRNFYSQLLIVSALEVFINSFFANSLFYPWTMAWLAILAAVSVPSRSKI